MRQRARADSLTICCRKKQIDISFSYVCPVIDNEFCHNIVKVVCGSTATLTMLWWRSWSITGHMHEKLMSICKFWLFNEINLWSYLWSWSWVIQYFILLIFILAVELLNTDFAMYFPRCLNYFLFSVNFL